MNKCPSGYTMGPNGICSKNNEYRVGGKLMKNQTPVHADCCFDVMDDAQACNGMQPYNMSGQCCSCSQIGGDPGNPWSGQWNCNYTCNHHIRDCCHHGGRAGRHGQPGRHAGSQRFARGGQTLRPKHLKPAVKHSDDDQILWQCGSNWDCGYGMVCAYGFCVPSGGSGGMYPGPGGQRAVSYTHLTLPTILLV